MVIPRSRSDFSLSSTQAYLKEPLPNSLASCRQRVSIDVVVVVVVAVVVG